MSAHSGALEAVDRVLNRGGAPDDVVREVVAALHERVFAWVAVVGADGAVRASAGDRREEPALTAAIAWQGKQVGELQAAPRQPAAGDGALLERVALVVSSYVR
jgi:hypothetical protein